MSDKAYRAADSVSVAKNMIDAADRNKRIKDNTLKTFTLKSGEKIIGAVQFDSYAGHTGRAPVGIDYLTVNPEVHLGTIQERGIGTELMRRVAEVAAKEKIGLQLVALPGSASFYRQLGMKLMRGEDRMYYLNAADTRKFAQGLKK